MINKVMTADEAVAGVKDGMTIMVGGFLATGSPEVLMDALVRKGVKHLTVIANDGGLDAGQPAGEFGGKTARGVGKLLEHHMVDHIIASHLGVNPKLNEQFAEGTLKYTPVSYTHLDVYKRQHTDRRCKDVVYVTGNKQKTGKCQDQTRDRS